MSRNEAVNYLEDIKNELEENSQDQPRNNGGSTLGQHNNFAFNRHSNRETGRMSSRDHERRPSLTVPMTSQVPSSFRKGQHLMNDKGESQLAPSSLLGMKHGYDSLSKTRYNTMGDDDRSSRRNRHGMSEEEIDYSDLLERLRIADFLYSEYSLEEVIYQLAKEMFTQSIIKGNKEAEESLLRFSNFLQEETAEGRISKELETKILDVVMAALMDSVGNQMVDTNQNQEHQSRLPPPGVSHSDLSRSGIEKILLAKSRGSTSKQDKKVTKSSETKEQQSTYDDGEVNIHKRDVKSPGQLSQKA